MGRPVKKSIIDLVYIHPHTGGSHLITKQKGSRRYECAGQGNSVFTLVASASPDVGQAYMVATDSHGNHYFVTKLTRHRATLYQKQLVSAPYEFANGKSVEWNPWNNAVANVSVVIENDY